VVGKVIVKPDRKLTLEGFSPLGPEAEGDIQEKMKKFLLKNADEWLEKVVVL